MVAEILYPRQGARDHDRLRSLLICLASSYVDNNDNDCIGGGSI